MARVARSRQPSGLIEANLALRRLCGWRLQNSCCGVGSSCRRADELPILQAAGWIGERRVCGTRVGQWGVAGAWRAYGFTVALCRLPCCSIPGLRCPRLARPRRSEFPSPQSFKPVLSQPRRPKRLRSRQASCSPRNPWSMPMPIARPTPVCRRCCMRLRRSRPVEAHGSPRPVRPVRRHCRARKRAMAAVSVPATTRCPQEMVAVRAWARATTAKGLRPFRQYR